MERHLHRGQRNGRPDEAPGAPNAAGFTLIELMIATAMTVALLGLTLTALNGAHVANSLGTMVLDTTQNLRAGMNFVIRDLSQAGNSIPVGGVPIPGGPGINPINRPGPTPGMTFPPVVLHAVTPGNGLGPTIDGLQTDMVTVTYADQSIALSDFPLVSVEEGGGKVTIDPRTNIDASNEIAEGDLILFSNAMGNAVQTVTSVEGSFVLRFGFGDPFNLNQRTATQGSVTQLQSSGVFPPTTVTRLVMVTYYLDATTVPSRPRLIRRTGFDPPRPVAIVVENLQMTYDLVDGSDEINPTLINIDEPSPPNTPAQMRKANFYMAARSDDLDVRSHRFFRTNLSTQVSFRSLAYFDRYQ